MSKDRSSSSPVKRLLFTLSVVALAVLATGVLFVSAVKVHDTWLLPKAPTGWNEKELAKIGEPGEEFSFAVMGDNKNSIKTFNLLKKSLQGQDLLFTMDVGDLVFDGEIIKYRLFINQVLGLKAPFITALGNHDIEGDGLKNYKQIFGPRYYSFTIADNYFIVLDDADGKSVDGEQMRWFERELRKGQSCKRRFVFMHVPPFRGLRNMQMPMREFLTDRKNADEIKKLCIRYTVDYVFGSHAHTFDFDLWPWNVHYLITGGGGAELWDVDRYRDMHHYIKINVTRDLVTSDVIPIFSSGAQFLYMYVEEPWIYTYAFVADNFTWLIACLSVALAAAAAAVVLLGRNRRRPER